MLAVYGKDAATCDEMTEAEFQGLQQHLEYWACYRPAQHVAHQVGKVVAAMLGAS